MRLFINAIQDEAPDSSLMELKEYMESGNPLEGLNEEAAKKVEKYLLIRRRGKNITVSYNEKAIAKAKEYNGFFTPVSNCIKDPFDCLSKYRRKKTIESFFEAGKQHADGTRPEVWNADVLRGREFVQFVSLCYYEYFNERVNVLQDNSGEAERRSRSRYRSQSGKREQTKKHG